ncbi:MAG: ribosomal-processing cysteine protease Prp [Clostridia bacterium]|nr:ribosomal-processing cysteine protease Prp [Clostridia bacterium]
MIRAAFTIRGDTAEFSVKGHSGAGEQGTDIICAAVSSAAYMAVNTVTEILGVAAEAEDRDGYMHFRSRGSKPAADIVKGLKLHLEQLAQQYPAFVTITTEE